MNEAAIADTTKNIYHLLPLHFKPNPLPLHFSPSWDSKSEFMGINAYKCTCKGERDLKGDEELEGKEEFEAFFPALSCPLLKTFIWSGGMWNYSCTPLHATCNLALVLENLLISAKQNKTLTKFKKAFTEPHTSLEKE